MRPTVSVKRFDAVCRTCEAGALSPQVVDDEWCLNPNKVVEQAGWRRVLFTMRKRGNREQTLFSFSLGTTYVPVDDGYDTRIPLHNEEAFKPGIRFRAKVTFKLVLQDLRAVDSTSLFAWKLTLCDFLLFAFVRFSLSALWKYRDRPVVSKSSLRCDVSGSVSV